MSEHVHRPVKRSHYHECECGWSTMPSFVRELLAEAWDEGYDACVIDSRKPVQDEATENPYRDGTWTKWDSPMFHEGRMWGRAEKEAEIEHRILKRKRLMEIPHAEEGDWLLTDSQAGDDED